MDDPRLGKKNLGILALIKTGLAAYMLSLQWHDRFHFAFFVMYSRDAKFEERRFNISRDLLD